jgi:hypothetical protein
LFFSAGRAEAERCPPHVQAAGTEKHVPTLRKIKDLQPVSLKLTKQQCIVSLKTVQVFQSRTSECRVTLRQPDLQF